MVALQFYTCAKFGELWPTNPWVSRVINLGAHSAKLELCARASIRLACFAGTCQILVDFVFRRRTRSDGCRVPLHTITSRCHRQFSYHGWHFAVLHRWVGRSPWQICSEYIKTVLWWMHSSARCSISYDIGTRFDWPCCSGLE